MAELTTIGRKSGLPRTVEVRLVYSNGHFYATTGKVENKHWCQNMIRNSVVEVKAKGQGYACIAKQVDNENLRVRILSLRDSPSLLDRVVFEMTPQ